MMTADLDETKKTVIGDRILYEGFIGTIKFHGEVPPASGKLWYGVEWDDRSRGKHSGEHEGVSYFECRQPGAGSFIKCSSKISFGQTFMEALKEKYLQVTDEDLSTDKERFFGDTKISVAMVGFDKVFRKQSNMANLIEVGLPSLHIATAGDKEEIKASVPKIVDLDLSRNLFSRWEELFAIAQQLSCLESFRLGSNRLRPLTVGPPAGTFAHLKVLSLDRMNLTWFEVMLLEPGLPQLESLHLGANNICSLQVDEQHVFVEGFTSLKLLNLEGNKLCSWSEIQRLSRLPNLESLFLQENQLVSIEYEGGFDTLVWMNLNYNQITAWHSIDQLGRFPALKELRFRQNPVVTLSDLSLESIRIQMIGRLAGLQAINGTQINGKERLDAELYYLKKCFMLMQEKEWTRDQLLIEHPRYADLCKVHGEPVSDDKRFTSSLLKDRLSEIHFHFEGKVVVKKLPGTTLVRQLRNMVQRFSRIPARSQRLFVSAEAEKEDAFRVEMEDDLRDLLFYNIEQSAHIHVKQII